ncbi:MAG: hypothetical protein QM736_17000 [Vicinamibacterales bacterium]
MRSKVTRHRTNTTGAAIHAWASTLRTTLNALHTLKSIPAVASFPIYGPSLTEQPAYAALGDIGTLIDRGNLHNYFAGRPPGTPGWGTDGYGSIDWNLRNIRPYSGGKPIVTTETGYTDDPRQPGHVPAAAAAIYMPRVVLEQFRLGIARTYIYELCDLPAAGGVDVGYGLLLRDGTPKPAFRSLANLLALLADPGAPFTVTPLARIVSGGGPDLRQMAFAKRDGSYHLALWLESAVYDVDRAATLAVVPQTITVTLPSTLQAIASRQWNADGTVATTPLTARSATVSVNVSERLLMLELRNTPPGAPTNLRVRPNP